MTRRATRLIPEQHVLESFLFGKITGEQLCKSLDSPFADFVVLDPNTRWGRGMRKLWDRHGARLLKEAGYKGMTRHSQLRNVLYRPELTGKYKNLDWLIGDLGPPKGFTEAPIGLPSKKLLYIFTV